MVLTTINEYLKLASKEEFKCFLPKQQQKQIYVSNSDLNLVHCVRALNGQLNSPVPNSPVTTCQLEIS